MVGSKEFDPISVAMEGDGEATFILSSAGDTLVWGVNQVVDGKNMRRLLRSPLKSVTISRRWCSNIRMKGNIAYSAHGKLIVPIPIPLQLWWSNNLPSSLEYVRLMGVTEPALVRALLRLPHLHTLILEDSVWDPVPSGVKNLYIGYTLPNEIVIPRLFELDRLVVFNVSKQPAKWAAAHSWASPVMVNEIVNGKAIPLPRELFGIPCRGDEN